MIQTGSGSTLRFVCLIQTDEGDGKKSVESSSDTIMIYIYIIFCLHFAMAT